MLSESKTIFIKISIEDELPKEYYICTFLAQVPTTSWIPAFPATDIEFAFKGFRDKDKILMHGLGEELAEGKVTHWLKEQEVDDTSNIVNYISWLENRIKQTEIEKNDTNELNLKIGKGGKLCAYKEALNYIRNHS